MSLNKDFQDGTFEIECSDRWSIYQRLQALGVPCSCSYYQPLKVQISSVMSAVQVWSVVRQFQMSRPVLVTHLEHCWYMV